MVNVYLGCFCKFEFVNTSKCQGERFTDNVYVWSRSG